jgi:predicted PurR-regulated permease PerM
MAAFMQCESFALALVVAGASLMIATVVGTFATSLLAGRIGRVNAAAVFFSQLLGGRLWRARAMLLGVPIIVIFTVILRHVERLRPIAELLGD